MNNKRQKVGFFERTERFFHKVIPSRQLLIKTNGRTHFDNLKSSTQVGVSAIIFCIVAWSIISIAIVILLIWLIVNRVRQTDNEKFDKRNN